MEAKDIEDIADPQPVEVTEYKISYYACAGCGEGVVARHKNMPTEGRFGYNVVVQTALCKYHARSVYMETTLL